MKKNDKNKSRQMTMGCFGAWLQEKIGAELKELPGRMECVISIDHIEPGCFVALFAVPSFDGLQVFELCGNYMDADAAWKALANREDTYPPLLFEEWVTQQYLTDRSATVEKLTIN